MKYTIKLAIEASMYRQGWSGNTEVTIDYDFSEAEMKQLAEHFQNYGPKDDVSEDVATYLEDFDMDIYEKAVEIVTGRTNYEGTAEELLEFLFSRQNIHIQDLADADHKRDAKVNAKASEAELTARWCERHRQEVEHRRYDDLALFFLYNYQLFVDFDNYIVPAIYLPQELYDAIRK